MLVRVLVLNVCNGKFIYLIIGGLLSAAPKSYRIGPRKALLELFKTLIADKVSTRGRNSMLLTNGASLTSDSPDKHKFTDVLPLRACT